MRRWRDRFWRAFWRRQRVYLPPAAQVVISNNLIRKDGSLRVVVGRDWDGIAEEQGLGLHGATNSLIQNNVFGVEE